MTSFTAARVASLGLEVRTPWAPTSHLHLRGNEEGGAPTKAFVVKCFETPLIEGRLCSTGWGEGWRSWGRSPQEADRELEWNERGAVRSEKQLNTCSVN